MNTARPKPQRAPDQTTITFSCPAQLKEQMREAAASEHRSLSNWIVCRLSDAVRQMESGAASGGALRAAENRSRYAAGAGARSGGRQDRPGAALS